MTHKEDEQHLKKLLSKFNDENENVPETLFTVYPEEMDVIVRLLHKYRVMLTDAIGMVGHPGTGHSANVDIHCEDLRKKFFEWDKKGRPV